MSYDNVTSYTLNRYPVQCNPTCTCRQSSTSYSTPGIFNFGMGEFGFGSANFSFYNFTNSFFAQIFNPFSFQNQFLNNLNFNFAQMFTPPAFIMPQIDASAIIPDTTLPMPSIPFGSLTTKTPDNDKRNTNITSVAAYSNRKSTLLKTVEKNDNNFAEQLKEKGVKYNSTLGHNLAQYTINHSTGGMGRCAHYVNNALEEYNINAKRDEHAYTRADVLAADKNFTEIKVNNENDLKALPGGSIVVYDAGACGYSSDHGHVFIATGNGGAVSDHIQNSIKFGTGVRVFIPTKQAATA